MGGSSLCRRLILTPAVPTPLRVLDCVYFSHRMIRSYLFPKAYRLNGSARTRHARTHPNYVSAEGVPDPQLSSFYVSSVPGGWVLRRELSRIRSNAPSAGQYVRYDYCHTLALFKLVSCLEMEHMKKEKINKKERKSTHCGIFIRYLPRIN